MGLFSGFKRGEKKKKLTKASPVPLLAERELAKDNLLSDDPYLHEKASKILTNTSNSDTFGAGWVATPSSPSIGVASASSLDIPSCPGTSSTGSANTLTKSASSGDLSIPTYITGQGCSDDGGQARPRASQDPEPQQRWVSRRSLSSRPRSAGSRPQSPPPPQAQRTSSPDVNDARLRGNSSDNEASTVSSALTSEAHSYSVDDRTSPCLPSSPPSSVSGFSSPVPGTKSSSPSVSLSPSGTTTSSERTPIIRENNTHRVGDRDGRDARDLEAAAPFRPLRPGSTPSVPFHIPPRTETRAKDAAKQKELAITVPRRRNWSVKLDQLERSWLEEQLTPKSHTSEHQSNEQALPPQQRAVVLTSETPTSTCIQHARHPRSPPPPPQQRQSSCPSHRPHQAIKGSWEDPLSSPSWKYPTMGLKNRQQETARGKPQGTSPGDVRTTNSPWPSVDWVTQGPQNTSISALRGSHSMQNLSKPQREQRHVRGWRGSPPPPPRGTSLKSSRPGADAFRAADIAYPAKGLAPRTKTPHPPPPPPSVPRGGMPSGHFLNSNKSRRLTANRSLDPSGGYRSVSSPVGLPSRQTPEAQAHPLPPRTVSVTQATQPLSSNRGPAAERLSQLPSLRPSRSPSLNSKRSPIQIVATVMTEEKAGEDEVHEQDRLTIDSFSTVGDRLAASTPTSTTVSKNAMTFSLPVELGSTVAYGNDNGNSDSHGNGDDDTSTSQAVGDDSFMSDELVEYYANIAGLSDEATRGGLNIQSGEILRPVTPAEKEAELSGHTPRTISPLSQPTGDAEPSSKANWPLSPTMFPSVEADAPKTSPLPLLSQGLLPAAAITANTTHEDRNAAGPENDGKGTSPEMAIGSPAFRASIYTREIGAGPYASDMSAEDDVANKATRGVELTPPSRSDTVTERPAPLWIMRARRQESVDGHSGGEVVASTAGALTTKETSLSEHQDNEEDEVLPEAIGVARGLSICEPDEGL